MALECKPPASRLHRALWAMGFTRAEREKIISIAAYQPFGDPVALGNHIRGCRLKEALAKLKAATDGP